MGGPQPGHHREWPRLSLGTQDRDPPGEPIRPHGSPTRVPSAAWGGCRPGPQAGPLGADHPEQWPGAQTEVRSQAGQPQSLGDLGPVAAPCKGRDGGLALPT